MKTTAIIVLFSLVDMSYATKCVDRYGDKTEHGNYAYVPEKDEVCYCKHGKWEECQSWVPGACIDRDGEITTPGENDYVPEKKKICTCGPDQEWINCYDKNAPPPTTAPTPYPCPEEVDECPNDPLKTRPGVCGCGCTDEDTDNDGTPNCFDLCPFNRWKISPEACGCDHFGEESYHDRLDDDGDLVINCLDKCPNDPLKTEPGKCGCGETESCCFDESGAKHWAGNWANSFDSFTGVSRECRCGENGEWTECKPVEEKCDYNGEEYEHGSWENIDYKGDKYCTCVNSVWKNCKQNCQYFGNTYSHGVWETIDFMDDKTCKCVNGNWKNCKFECPLGNGHMSPHGSKAIIPWRQDQLCTCTNGNWNQCKHPEQCHYNGQSYDYGSACIIDEEVCDCIFGQWVNCRDATADQGNSSPFDSSNLVQQQQQNTSEQEAEGNDATTPLPLGQVRLGDDDDDLNSDNSDDRQEYNAAVSTSPGALVSFILASLITFISVRL